MNSNKLISHKAENRWGILPHSLGNGEMVNRNTVLPYQYHLLREGFMWSNPNYKEIRSHWNSVPIPNPLVFSCNKFAFEECLLHAT